MITRLKNGDIGKQTEVVSSWISRKKRQEEIDVRLILLHLKPNVILIMSGSVIGDVILERLDI